MEISELYDKIPYRDDNSDFSVLLKSLPKDVNTKEMDFLEVGCGSGHITENLSGFFRTARGVDLSEKSICAAKKRIRGENRLSFSQANLFDENFLDESREKYDFVLCYGVLHHTKNPRDGYGNLCKLVKRGGFLLTGVYSRTMVSYRIKRKMILSMSKNEEERYHNADRLLFGGNGDPLAISDGYVNPIVSYHSISEVLGWMEGNGMEYVGSFPRFEISSYPGFFWDRIWRVEYKRPETKIRKTFLEHNILSTLFVEMLWLASGKQIMINACARKA